MSGITTQLRFWQFSFASGSEKRHRAILFLITAVAAACTLAIGIYGWNYYTLDLEHRPFSPKYALLKPGGAVGLRLGMAGLGMLFLIYLYPLRKHWQWLSLQGKAKHWLNYHVLLGILAPVVISFHSSFKFRGIAGIAYWTMIVLTVSGLIGRYLYAQVSLSLDAAGMCLKELRDVRTRLTQQCGSLWFVPAREMERVFQVPTEEEIGHLTLLGAMLIMVRTDLIRTIHIWKLRRRYSGVKDAVLNLGGIVPTANNELEFAVGSARRQALLLKKVVFLSRTRRMFQYWHVVHRPLSFSFVLLVFMHVLVAILLGYFRIS